MLNETEQGARIVGLGLALGLALGLPLGVASCKAVDQGRTAQGDAIVLAMEHWEAVCAAHYGPGSSGAEASFVRDYLDEEPLDPPAAEQPQIPGRDAAFTYPSGRFGPAEVNLSESEREVGAAAEAAWKKAASEHYHVAVDRLLAEAPDPAALTEAGLRLDARLYPASRATASRLRAAGKTFDELDAVLESLEQEAPSGEKGLVQQVNRKVAEVAFIEARAAGLQAALRVFEEAVKRPSNAELGRPASYVQNAVSILRQQIEEAETEAQAAREEAVELGAIRFRLLRTQRAYRTAVILDGIANGKN